MQTQSPHPQIPKAVIFSPVSYLQQRIQDEYGYPEVKTTFHEIKSSQATEKALLKYYPKHCHAIRLDCRPKSYSTLSRVKKIKTLNHFEYDFADEAFDKKNRIVKKMKELLGSKRRSLKSLPVIGFKYGPKEKAYQFTIIEMCYFFPNVQSLTVCLPITRFPHAKLSFRPKPPKKKILFKAFGRLWDFLKNVKHFEISNELQNLWTIPYLQKSKKFLSSLQSFHLTIEPPEPMDLTDRMQLFFQAFLQNPCLPKFVTHINLHYLIYNAKTYVQYVDYNQDDQVYWERIQSILHGCSKLQSITLPIGEKICGEQGKLPSSVNAITLTASNMKGFLEDFEFPLHLRKLTLDKLNLSDVWNALKLEQKDKGKPHKDTLISKFCGRLNNLSCLSFLQLNMKLFTSPNDIQNGLITPMLQATPKLEKFECVFSQVLEDHNNSFDLSILFNSFTSLNRLQSFKISQSSLNDERHIRHYHLLVTFSPQKAFSFPNISSIHIGGLISDGFDFRAFFMAFSEGSEIKEISLPKVHLGSIESFCWLLVILKEAENLKNLRIHLNIVLLLESWEDIENYLQDAIILAPGIYVTLKIYVSSTKRVNLTSDQRTTLQRIFGKMKFSINLVIQEECVSKSIQLVENSKA